MLADPRVVILKTRRKLSAVSVITCLGSGVAVFRVSSFAEDFERTTCQMD